MLQKHPNLVTPVLVMALCFFSGLSYASGFLHKNTYCTEQALQGVGPISILVNGSEFQTISPESPGYMRIQLEGAYFQSSVVPLGGVPIFLEPRLIGTEVENFEGTLALQSADVSLVRWIAGENALWIKFSKPTTTWIVDASGVPLDWVGPLRVTFTVGIGADEWSSDFGVIAPLPGPNHEADGTPADTRNMIVLEGTDLELHSLEMTDTVGVETESDPSDIQIGHTYLQLGPNSRPLQDCNRLALPWVSYNDQFQSTVVLNNPSDEDHLVNVMAFRDAIPIERSLSVPAGGFVALSVTEVFDFLQPGAGMAWFVDSPLPGLKGSWITEGLTGASGRSPAKGLAVPLNSADLVGQELLFSALPLRDDTFAAMVVVNAGLIATDIQLTVRDQNGQILAQDDARFQQWPPNQPLAIVVSDLLPPELDLTQIPWVSIQVSSSGQPLLGAEFSFNDQREPAINNAIKMR